MGVTVFYRGSLADIDRVEEFEDRVLDLALEIGGHAHIWRSVHDDDPRRVVRGLRLDLYPGQETTSLLISPEGWLINLLEIEDAEKGQLAEPPWCSVKTQFGPLEGHVAVITLLSAIQREFFPNLEVRDEGGYWETRDLALLREKMASTQSAIDGLADSLRQYGLTAEAAEDPDILTARIARVAALVQHTLGRPPEHPPVDWGNDSDGGFDSSLDGTEAQWDAEFKEQRRKQERLYRRIEERRARGEAMGDALEAAMRDEVIIDLPGEQSPAADSFETWEDQPDEAWRESLSDMGDNPDEDRTNDCLDDNGNHPLLERVKDLNRRLYDLAAASEGRADDNFHSLLGAAGEMLGGLAQALGDREFEQVTGLALVQLKRALRGAAFAFGRLFQLRAEGSLAPVHFDELAAALTEMQTDIYAELIRLRETREPG